MAFRLSDRNNTPLGVRPTSYGFGLVPTAEDVAEAVDRRVGLSIGGLAELSLEVLRAGVPGLRGLELLCGRVLDLPVLEAAAELEWLWMGDRPTGRADLSGLPKLRAYQGPLSASVASVAGNPHLEVVQAVGAFSKRLPVFAGPVREFTWQGGRSQTAVPGFAQPEALRWFAREGVARFDLAELLPFREVEHVRIVSCPEVVNLAAAAQLPRLQVLTFLACDSVEPWESIPDQIPRVNLWEPRRLPSRGWLEAAEARGWSLPSWRSQLAREEARGSGAAELFPVSPAADGEDEWDVVEYDATWLDGPLSAVRDRGPATGVDVQRLMKRMVRELRAEGEVLRVQFDSESGMFAAYFPNEDHAQRFAAAARALAADPDRIHTLLTNG